MERRLQVFRMADLDVRVSSLGVQEPCAAQEKTDGDHYIMKTNSKPHVPPVIQVTAGLIRRRGKVLLARRGGTGPLAGLWEFPGGKIEPGESPEACLARELDEELGLSAKVGAHLQTARHRQGGRIIELIFFAVSCPRGRVHVRDHLETAWVLPRDVLRYPLIPADRAFAKRQLRRMQ
jgi:mutator protein MutT